VNKRTHRWQALALLRMARKLHVLAGASIATSTA
jgi:hypothetical protein